MGKYQQSWQPFCERFHNSLPQLPLTQEVASDITSIYFSSFFRSSYLNFNWGALMLKVNEIKLLYTDELVQMVENVTKNQSKCKEWYHLRAGRITASVFKSVCRTSLLTPSVSLIQRICYPDGNNASSAAMNYGKENESTAARACYGGFMKNHHHSLIVEECGLRISNKYPHLGASPDGIISCDCCGVGVIEIKCPYSARNDPNLTAYIKKKGSPVKIYDQKNFSIHMNIITKFKCRCN